MFFSTTELSEFWSNPLILPDLIDYLIARVGTVSIRSQDERPYPIDRPPIPHKLTTIAI